MRTGARRVIPRPYRSTGRRAALLAAACLAACGGGCFVRAVDSTGDGRVRLLPPAGELVGRRAEALVVSADRTKAGGPLQADTIRRIAQQSRPAVLSVYTRTETPHEFKLVPILGPGITVRVPGVGLGSGFIIHPDGWLLTNDHVIADATSIRGLSHDGTDHALTVVARDPTYDVALLRIDEPNGPMPHLPMGDSTQMDIGEMVIAVGNPIGLGHTVTSGIISQTGRELAGAGDASDRRVRYLQTDAAINPGSSGGPLITLRGSWVGINTAKAQNASGIGFAVPSEQVREFLDIVRRGASDR